MSEQINDKDRDTLSTLSRQLFGTDFQSIDSMVSHASPRRRYRIKVKDKTLVGVLNDNTRENDAFVYFAKVFKDSHLPVPEVYIYNEKAGAWLEEDLGHSTLFEFIKESPEQKEFLYKKSVEHLVDFQIIGGQKIDFKKSLDRGAPSKTFYQDILDAFKKDLIERVGLDFDQKKFESEGDHLISLLNPDSAKHFLYRDFQSRNIMVKDSKLFFIDFQSGRQGHLPYDLVSLLYQVSTKLSDELRDTLISHYCDSLKKHLVIDINQFKSTIPLYVIARMMQVLSTYGRQGLGLKKEYFLNNISSALVQLKNTLAEIHVGNNFDEIKRIVEKLGEKFL